MARSQNRYIFAQDAERRRKPHRFRNAVILFFIILIASLFIMNFVISNRVVFKTEKITLLNLPDDLENYTILHISDLNGAELGEKQKAIATALGNTRYSCVVMTGDMLGENRDVQPLLDLIALMPPETPKYYIPGDHDGSFIDPQAHGNLTVYADWAKKLQDAGVTLLDYPASETRGKSTIWFIPEELYSLNAEGMLDIYKRQLKKMEEQTGPLSADEAAMKRVLEYEIGRMQELIELRQEVKPEDIQVVLTHMPLTEEYISEMQAWTGKNDIFSFRYASLILAGHYNGGQWRVPFGPAIYVPGLGWFPEDEKIQGTSYVFGIPQVISRGLGSSDAYPHMKGRLFNSPEITLITLTSRYT